jgi:hypothetical protein
VASDVILPRNISQFIDDINNQVDVPINIPGGGVQAICPIECDFLTANELLRARNIEVGIEINVGTGDLLITGNEISSNNNQIVLEPDVGQQVLVRGNFEIDGVGSGEGGSFAKICTENLIICDPVPIIGFLDDLPDGSATDDNDDRGFEFDWPEVTGGGVLKRIGYWGWDRQRDRFVYWKRAGVDSGPLGVDQNYFRSSSARDNEVEFDVVHTNIIQGLQYNDTTNNVIITPELLITTPTELNVFATAEEHTVIDYTNNVRGCEEHIIGALGATTPINSRFRVRTVVDDTMNRIELDFKDDTDGVLNLFQEKDIQIMTFEDNSNTSGILIDSGDRVDIRSENTMALDSNMGSITVTSNQLVNIESETSDINIKAEDVVTIESVTDYVKITPELRVDIINDCTPGGDIAVNSNICLDATKTLFVDNIRQKDFGIDIIATSGDITVETQSNGTNLILRGEEDVIIDAQDSDITMTAQSTITQTTDSGDISFTAGGSGDITLIANNDTINMDSNKTLFSNFIEFEPVSSINGASNNEATIWFHNLGTPRLVTNRTSDERSLVLGPAGNATARSSSIAIFSDATGFKILDSDIIVSDNDMTFLNIGGSAGSIIMEDSNGDDTYTIVPQGLSSNIILRLPSSSDITSTTDTFVLKNTNDAFTNKTICDSSNDVAANKLWRGDSDNDLKVSIENNNPAVGEVLKITNVINSTTATAEWQPEGVTTLQQAYNRSIFDGDEPEIVLSSGGDNGITIITSSSINAPEPMFQLAQNSGSNSVGNNYFSVNPDPNNPNIVIGEDSSNDGSGTNVCIFGSSRNNEPALDIKRNTGGGGQSIFQVIPNPPNNNDKHVIINGNLNMSGGSSQTGTVCNTKALHFTNSGNNSANSSNVVPTSLPSDINASDLVRVLYFDGDHLRRLTSAGNAGNHFVEITDNEASDATVNQIVIMSDTTASSPLKQIKTCSNGTATITEVSGECVLTVDNIDVNENIDVGGGLSIVGTSTLNEVDVDANANFAGPTNLNGTTNLNNTINLTDMSTFCVENGASFQLEENGAGGSKYTISPGSIGGNSIITLPTSSGAINDTFVLEDTSQTLTNKVLEDDTTTIADLGGNGILSFDFGNAPGPTNLTLKNTFNHTSNICLSLPVPNPYLDDNIVSRTSIDSLINKTICDSTNDVAANKIWKGTSNSDPKVVVGENPSTTVGMFENYILALDSYDNMTNEFTALWKAQTGSSVGGGTVDVTLQIAYDNSTNPAIINQEPGKEIQIVAGDTGDTGPIFEIIDNSTTIFQVNNSNNAQQVIVDGKTLLNGNTTIDGELTVTGIVDTTGIEFNSVGTNPGTDDAKTLWIDGSNRFRKGDNQGMSTTDNYIPEITGDMFGAISPNELVKFDSTGASIVNIVPTSLVQSGLDLEFDPSGILKVNLINEVTPSQGVEITRLVLTDASNSANKYNIATGDLTTFGMDATVNIPVPDSASDDFVLRTMSQTLENKVVEDGTFSSMGLNSFSFDHTNLTADRTFLMPDFDGELVGVTAVQKLTNKSIGDDLDMCKNKIINVAAATDACDAVNKAYIDALTLPLSIKQSVRVATTDQLSAFGDTGFNYDPSGDGGIGEITWSNGPTEIDDIILNNGDRILVKDQLASEITDITVSWAQQFGTGTNFYSNGTVPKFFNINSGGDINMYRIWFNTGALTQPGAGGRTLVEVDINGDTEASDVSNSLKTQLDILGDFTTREISATVIFEVIANGSISQSIDSSMMPTNTTSSVRQTGNLLTQEVSDLTVPPGSFFNSTGASNYFEISSDTDDYYIWFQNGLSTDPGPIGSSTGIMVSITTNDSASDIADAILLTFSASPLIVEFEVGIIDVVLRVLTNDPGSVTNATWPVLRQPTNLATPYDHSAGINTFLDGSDTKCGPDNGIWVRIDQNTWRRSDDMNTIAETAKGCFTVVDEGTVNECTSWIITVEPDTDLGTDPICWSVFYKFTDLIAGDGLTKTGNRIDVVGSSTIVANPDNIQVASSTNAGEVLISGGNISTEPNWGPLNVANPNSVSGALPVEHGGTNVTTFGGTNTILYTTLTDTLSSIPTANNSVLITNSSGVPTLSTSLPANSISVTGLTMSCPLADKLYLGSPGTEVMIFPNAQTMATTVTIPDLGGTPQSLVFTVEAQTLENKQLFNPTLVSPTVLNNELNFNNGTITVKLSAEPGGFGSPCVEIPNSGGLLITDDSSDVLTNKDIIDTSNTVYAKGIFNTENVVTTDDSGSLMPEVASTVIPLGVVGQVLEASSSGTARWQTFDLQKAYNAYKIGGSGANIFVDSSTGPVIVNGGNNSQVLFEVRDFSSTNYINVDTTPSTPKVTIGDIGVDVCIEELIIGTSLSIANFTIDCITNETDLGIDIKSSLSTNGHIRLLAESANAGSAPVVSPDDGSLYLLSARDILIKNENNSILEIESDNIQLSSLGSASSTGSIEIQSADSSGSTGGYVFIQANGLPGFVAPPLPATPSLGTVYLYGNTVETLANTEAVVAGGDASQTFGGYTTIKAETSSASAKTPEIPTTDGYVYVSGAEGVEVLGRERILIKASEGAGSGNLTVQSGDQGFSNGYLNIIAETSIQSAPASTTVDGVVALRGAESIDLKSANSIFLNSANPLQTGKLIEIKSGDNSVSSTGYVGIIAETAVAPPLLGSTDGSIYLTASTNVEIDTLENILLTAGTDNTPSVSGTGGYVQISAASMTNLPLPPDTLQKSGDVYITSGGDGGNIIELKAGSEVLINGDGRVTNELTVNGLIDEPIGLTFTGQTVRPNASLSGFGTVWVRDNGGTDVDLMFTNANNQDIVIESATDINLDEVYRNGVDPTINIVNSRGPVIIKDGLFTQGELFKAIKNITPEESFFKIHSEQGVIVGDCNITSDPMINGNGIQVDINYTDLSTLISEKIVNEINANSGSIDASATVVNAKVRITNNFFENTTNPTNPNMPAGSGVSTFLQGTSRNPEVFDLIVIDGGSYSTVNPANYFQIHSFSTDYFVWFNNGGSLTQPAGLGTPIEVMISPGDSIQDVAIAVRDAINVQAGTDFSSVIQEATFKITNTNIGSVNNIIVNGTMPTSTSTFIVTNGAPGFAEETEVTVPNGSEFISNFNSAFYFSFFTISGFIETERYVWFDVMGLPDNPTDLSVAGNIKVKKQILMEGGGIEGPVGIEFSPQITNPVTAGLWEGDTGTTLWVETPDSLKYGDLNVLLSTITTASINAIPTFADTLGTTFQDTGVTIEQITNNMDGVNELCAKRFAPGYVLYNGNMPFSTTLVEDPPVGINESLEQVHILDTLANGNVSDFTLPPNGKVGRYFIFKNESITDDLQVQDFGSNLLTTLTTGEYIFIYDNGSSWDIVIRGKTLDDTVNVSNTMVIGLDLTLFAESSFALNTTGAGDSSFNLPSLGISGREYIFRNNSVTDRMIIQDATLTEVATLFPKQFARIREVDLGSGNEWLVMFQGTVKPKGINVSEGALPVVVDLTTVDDEIFILATTAGPTLPSTFTLPTADDIGREYIFRNLTTSDKMEVYSPGPILLQTIYPHQFIRVVATTVSSVNQWVVLTRGEVRDTAVNVDNSATPTIVSLTTENTNTFVYNNSGAINGQYLLPAVGTGGRQFMFRNKSATSDMEIRDSTGLTILYTLTTNEYAIIQEMDIGSGDEWVILFRGTSIV